MLMPRILKSFIMTDTMSCEISVILQAEDKEKSQDIYNLDVGGL
jgi:hypothetical protein